MAEATFLPPPERGPYTFTPPNMLSSCQFPSTAQRYDAIFINHFTVENYIPIYNNMYLYRTENSLYLSYIKLYYCGNISNITTIMQFYCIVFFHIMLYHNILYSIMSHHIIFYHIILYSIMSYHIMLYHNILYSIMSYHIIFYHIILYCIISHCISMHHITSHHMILFCIILYIISY